MFRPLLRGGGGRGGSIYSNGVFVHTILADWYNNRRELWVVSLESLSSEEYGFKKIFSIFAFYRELSNSKVLWILEVIQLFLFTFLNEFLSNLTKFLSIMLKFVKIVNISVIDFISKARRGFVWSEFFG